MTLIYLLLVVSVSAMALPNRLKPIVFGKPQLACYQQSTDGTPVVKLYVFPEADSNIITVLATLPQVNISFDRKYLYQPSEIQVFHNETYIHLENCENGREDFKVCSYSVKKDIFSTTQITGQAFNEVGCTYKVVQKVSSGIGKISNTVEKILDNNV